MGNRIVVRWAALCALLLAGVAQASPGIGEAPPDLLGKTTKGEEVRLSDRRGKVVMVGFWASWCPYCRKQFPMLESFQRQAGKEQLDVVVVNFQEPPATFRQLVRKLKDIPVTWAHDRDGSISEAYGVKSVPHLFVIDRRGALAHVARGYSDGSVAELAEVVNRLMAEPVPEDASSAVEAQGGDAAAGPAQSGS